MPAPTSNRPREHGWFWDKLDEYLARHQLKQTKQRKLITEYFLNLNTHVSAEDLHMVVRKDYPNIGLATIYRTLKLLADSGLADQKVFGEGRTLFEIATPGEHHDHLICVDCGKVFEFENEEIERLQEKVAQKHKFQLTSHRLDLFGRCLTENCPQRAQG